MYIEGGGKGGHKRATAWLHLHRELGIGSQWSALRLQFRIYCQVVSKYITEKVLSRFSWFFLTFFLPTEADNEL